VENVRRSTSQRYVKIFPKKDERDASVCVWLR